MGEDQTTLTGTVTGHLYSWKVRVSFLYASSKSGTISTTPQAKSEAAIVLGVEGVEDRATPFRSAC